MKTAIIIANGIKQIMFTPENDTEKQALAMITLDDNITVESKRGTFYNNAPKSAAGYTVEKCQGGYLRAFDSEESLMFVLTPKNKTQDKTEVQPRADPNGSASQS